MKKTVCVGMPDCEARITRQAILTPFEDSLRSAEKQCRHE